MLLPGSKAFSRVIRHHLHINESTPLLQWSTVTKNSETEDGKFISWIETTISFFLRFSPPKKRPHLRTNKLWKTTLPVSTASASFVFQCLAMFSESGSSGFGALKSAWMLTRKTHATKLLSSKNNLSRSMEERDFPNFNTFSLSEDIIFNFLIFYSRLKLDWREMNNEQLNWLWFVLFSIPMDTNSTYV